MFSEENQSVTMKLGGQLLFGIYLLFMVFRRFSAAAVKVANSHPFGLYDIANRAMRCPTLVQNALLGSSCATIVQPLQNPRSNATTPPHFPGKCVFHPSRRDTQSISLLQLFSKFPISRAVVRNQQLMFG
jgi:hypothetical protein